MTLRLILEPSAAPPGVVDRLDPAGDGAWLLSGAGWAMRVDPDGNVRPASPPPPRASWDEDELVVGEALARGARLVLLADPDGYTLVRVIEDEEEEIAAFSSAGAAALAPDGRVVVVRGGDVAVRGESAIIARLAPPVRALAIADGDLAAVDAVGLHVVERAFADPAEGGAGASGGTARLVLDLGTHIPLHNVRSRGGTVAAWGPEPAIVVMGGGQRRIALTAPPRGADVLPDGRVVVAHGARLDAFTGESAETLYRGPDLRLFGGVGDTLLVGHAPLSPDAHLLGVSTSGAAPLATRVRDGTLVGAALSRDGRWLLVSKGTGKAALFDTQERRVVRTFDIDPRALGASRFAPAGPGWLVWAAPGGSDTYPTMLSAGPEEEGSPIAGPAGAGLYAFGPDGERLLATRIGDRTWLVDVAERAVRAILPISGSAVWDPEGRRLAGLADGGRSLGVFDRDGQPLAATQIPPCRDVAWHGEELLLATSGGLRVVRLGTE